MAKLTSWVPREDKWTEAMLNGIYVNQVDLQVEVMNFLLPYICFFYLLLSERLGLAVFGSVAIWQNIHTITTMFASHYVIGMQSSTANVVLIVMTIYRRLGKYNDFIKYIRPSVPPCCKSKQQ